MKLIGGTMHGMAALRFARLERYIYARLSRKVQIDLRRKSPSDIAHSLGPRNRGPNSLDHDARSDLADGHGSAWRRETFTLPRAEARIKAREWFSKFPKAAYATEIEFWREMNDGWIEFTIRRLPTAD
jgi:hypothetical protein